VISVNSSAEPPASSGLLLIDKPRGVTSHDVVAAVRNTLHMRRVGHAGTLDPMATGLLIVGFGHATRLLNYVMGHKKTYEATIRLGQSTTTDDVEGDFTPGARLTVDELIRLHRGPRRGLMADDRRKCDVRGTGSGEDEAAQDELDIMATLVRRVIDDHLLGDIEQVPSSYSAIKVNGQRAYERARSGMSVRLEPRPVTIHGCDVHGIRWGTCANTVDVDVLVTCSAGTYIRALARDLGRLLEVGGYLIGLRRIRIGDFDINGDDPVVTAHDEEQTFTNREGLTVTKGKAILDADERGVLDCALTMLQAARKVIPTAPISSSQAEDLRCGRRIECSMSSATALYEDGTDDLVAIGEPAGSGRVRSAVVFPLG
jgi:tRNA pseudouridine55 synthase